MDARASRAQQASGQQAQSEDTNNLLFQALMNQKQKQLQDSRSIADSIFSKRRMQDETRTVVSAAASYANNAHYISINSAKDARIQLSRNMHPLNPGE